MSTTTSRRPQQDVPQPTRRLDVGIVLIALMVALFVAQLLWVVTTRMDTSVVSSSAEQHTGGSR